jgi:AAA ATPase domain
MTSRAFPADPSSIASCGRAAAGGAAARALTPFVGREEDLGLLARRFERARGGEGQFVQVVGEPGLGKSRLVEEFRIRLGETPHTWVEWASSQLLQNTPLHPLADWGRLRFGGADVAADKRLAELEQALGQVKLDAGENAALLAPLLDIPLPEARAPKLAPEELRRRQLAAVSAWILAGARTQALVLAFEDLHWADPTTLDLMKTLVERGARRETRSKLHSGYALATMMTKGYGAEETRAALAKAEGASGVAKTPEYWTVRYGRLVGDLMAAKFDAMREGAIAFIAEADAAGQPGHVSVARRVLGFAKIITGDFAGAVADLRRAVAEYDGARDAELNTYYGHDLLANALATLAQATWYLGDVDEAERLADTAIARAEASGRVVSQIQAIACRSFSPCNRTGRRSFWRSRERHSRSPSGTNSHSGKPRLVRAFSRPAPASANPAQTPIARTSNGARTSAAV